MSAWDYIIIAYAVFATYRVGKLTIIINELRNVCADLESRLILITLSKGPNDKFH
jgi:hypothetical protein